MKQEFLEFEWDSNKALRNVHKHEVSFSEAIMVFNDNRAITFYDDAHSYQEQRFATIGMSDRGRVLVVSHAVRGENIRLISARKATPRERKIYEKQGK
jgi:uncharacterized DUF497 family protein